MLPRKIYFARNCLISRNFNQDPSSSLGTPALEGRSQKVIAAKPITNSSHRRSNCFYQFVQAAPFVTPGCSMRGDKRLAQTLQIVRQLAFEETCAAADRMDEAERCGMQRLAIERQQPGLRLAPNERRLGLEAAPVERIAENGM